MPVLLSRPLRRTDSEQIGPATVEVMMANSVVHEAPAFEPSVFLSTAPATPRDGRLALIAVSLSLLIFVAAVPFARLPLTEVWAFIPTYESALVVSDLVAAVLLFAQFSILRSSALLVLACGYLFTALIAVAHMLTFPGLFSPTGMLGAHSQSTAWLYMFWHGVFPISVVAYALLKGSTRATRLPRASIRLALVFGVVSVIAAVVALTSLSTIGGTLLPNIMQGNNYSPIMVFVVSAVWLLSGVAIVVLWVRRPHTVLDLWLMVVMCAWIFDLALSAVFNAGRFDLGFYAGRVYGLLAATSILLVLLLETGALYVQLARLLGTEQRERKREVEERHRIFDISVDLILVTNPHGDFIRVSQSATTLLGYDPEEMVGHSASEFIYPTDLEPTRNEMRLARRERQMRSFETRYVHKDGRLITLAWTGAWSEPTQQHLFIGRDMTEKKVAEEKFREQKFLLDSALNNMHHGLVMFDRNNRAVVINQTYIEMYRLSPDLARPGCTMSQLLEQRAANGTFGGDIDDYIENEVVHGEVVDRIFNNPDGRSIRVVNRIMADGSWVSAHEDVTERQKTEAAIRGYAEREQLFIAAVESSNDAIVTKSLGGVITGWNQAAERLFGFTSEEAIGKSIDIIVPEELRDEVRAMLIKVKNGDKIDHHETVRINKHGRRIDVSLGVSPVKSQSGAIIGAAKVARDITARKKAQEALLESERMAQDIITGALDGFIQINEPGQVTEWNPQAEVIFGWSRAEALGKRLTELFSPPGFQLHHREMIAQLRNADEGAKVGERFEYEAVRKDGRKIKVETSLTALRRRDGCVFNGFVRDLTEKIAAEEQLKQAQKMESVGQLTGGIAHDFNNMLTVITGTIDILADAVADKPQLAAIAKLISEAADRGAELTGHLLAFARKQPLQPCETNINSLMAETGSLLRPTLGEHIEIETILDRDVWSALVDPSQLSSVLLNLAINSRDAMPNGGKLMLETSNVVLDHTYAKTNPDVQPGDYVLIAVSDTGDGIPTAIRDRIFEPFFTTKDVGKGTGLGLSMVYGFIKQSGGHIKVYSEEGHGTTFKIYLPRAGAQAEPVAVSSTDSQIEGGNETILIVEDDPLVRTSVTAQIQSLGYQTLSAANAAEALAIVDDGAQFDLLFTDVIMPGKINGRQLAEELTKRRTSLKVLFTSGYTENALIHHGRLDPGVLLLAKPYRKQELARTLLRAFGRVETSASRIRQPLKSQAI
jgi:PAS domain S-box-containing protein